jgi:predicted 3-demethylubiquinone-9 3-methyltransferase (glyoxalase superfamily)
MTGSTEGAAGGIATGRRNSMQDNAQKIIPNLWFDRQAEEAAGFYTSIFKNSKVGDITRAGKAGQEITGLSEGTVMTVEFAINGFKFIAINGGPVFKFNPSVSFLAGFETKEEVDAVWGKLSPGGRAMMDLGSYPHSERYGWIVDKYGLSWQIMYMGERRMNQPITPVMMFMGPNWGKAETAINFYASVFHNSAVGGIMRYDRGMEPDKEGTIQYAAFTLEGQGFAAMDSARMHDFNFNEAISLMVTCRTQEEIDFYWGKLTANGGQEGPCGWLKDKFGFSWQVAPLALKEMLHDSNKEKVARVTSAFLKMKKLNIRELEAAFQGESLIRASR